MSNQTKSATKSLGRNLSKQVKDEIKDFRQYIGLNIVHHLHDDYEILHHQIKLLQNFSHFQGLHLNASGTLGHYRREMMAGSAALVLLTMLTYNTVQAAPQGGSIAAGTATISVSGATTNISQSSTNATINWNSFNVAANETVNFYVPSSSSATLNRINSPTASTIAGSIWSNGAVYFVNPNGMVFSAGSSVIANAVGISTGAIDAHNFRGGQADLSAFAIPTGGSVSLNGSIIAQKISVASKQMIVGGQVSATNRDLSGSNNSLTLRATDSLNIVSSAQLFSGNSVSGGGVISLTATNSMALNSGATIRVDSLAGNAGAIDIKAATFSAYGAAMSGKALSKTFNSQSTDKDGTLTLESTAGVVVFNAPDYAGFSKIILKAAGDIGINGAGSFGSLTINANGSIWQEWEKGLTLESLKINVGGEIYMGGGNQIARIEGITASGDNLYVNYGSNMTLAGTVENRNGGFALLGGTLNLTDGSALVATKRITLGGTVDGSKGGHLVINTAEGGDLVFAWGGFNKVNSVNWTSRGNIAANLSTLNMGGYGTLTLDSNGTMNLTGNGNFGVINLNANGKISQNNGSSLTAATLGISARNSVSLNGSNAIGNLNNVTAASDLTMVLGNNMQETILLGSITAGGAIQLSGGDLKINGTKTIQAGSGINFGMMVYGSQNAKLTINTGLNGTISFNGNQAMANFHYVPSLTWNAVGNVSLDASLNSIYTVTVNSTGNINFAAGTTASSFGTLRLNSGGQITQAAGGNLTISNLSATAATGINLLGNNNRINFLDGITISGKGDLAINLDNNSITNHQTIIGSNISVANGSITLNAQGFLMNSMSGAISVSASNNVSFSGQIVDNIKGLGLNVTATSGTINFGKGTQSISALNLVAGNGVTAGGNIDGAGSGVFTMTTPGNKPIVFSNNSGLSNQAKVVWNAAGETIVSGNFGTANIAANAIINATGDISFAQNVVLGAVTLNTTGKVTIGNGQLAMNNLTVNATGGVTVQGTVSIGNSLIVNSSSGSISQAANSNLTIGILNASAVSGINLTGTNNISVITGLTNSGKGDIAVSLDSAVKNGKTSSILGNISAANGSVTLNANTLILPGEELRLITASNNVTFSGLLWGSSFSPGLTVTATSGTITLGNGAKAFPALNLTAGNGIVTGGNIDGGRTGVLTMTTPGSKPIVFNNNSSWNNIAKMVWNAEGDTVVTGVFGAANNPANGVINATGDISFAQNVMLGAITLNTKGKVTIGNGTLAMNNLVVNATGGVTVQGTVAIGNSLTVTSSGAITQAANSTLRLGSLNATAVNGINLSNSSNDIVGISGLSNSGQGDIVVAMDGGNKPNGRLSFINSNVTASNGSVTITASRIGLGNNLTNITAGGNITLNGQIMGPSQWALSQTTLNLVSTVNSGVISLNGGLTSASLGLTIGQGTGAVTRSLTNTTIAANQYFGLVQGTIIQNGRN